MQQIPPPDRRPTAILPPRMQHALANQPHRPVKDFPQRRPFGRFIRGHDVDGDHTAAVLPLAGNADAVAGGEGHLLDNVVAAENLASGFGAVGGDQGGEAEAGVVVEAAESVAR